MLGIVFGIAGGIAGGLGGISQCRENAYRATRDDAVRVATEAANTSASAARLALEWRDIANDALAGWKDANAAAFEAVRERDACRAGRRP